MNDRIVRFIPALDVVDLEEACRLVRAVDDLPAELRDKLTK